MNKMTSEKARHVRAQGHADALRFARLIGQPGDYQNNPKAKKDVVDLNGDTHSVKSGQLKWQIFLYNENRFLEDPGFGAMNGIGEIIISCLQCHPKERPEYLQDKARYKEALRPHMRDLKERLDDPRRRSAFFAKAFFNGGEVNYLTILHSDVYHVFAAADVVRVLSAGVNVKNSQARRAYEYSEQKTVFYTDSTIGEIEIRHDPVHYVAVKFWMFKEKTLRLLQDEIKRCEEWSQDITVYGIALVNFKSNHKNLLSGK